VTHLGTIVGTSVWRPRAAFAIRERCRGSSVRCGESTLDEFLVEILPPSSSRLLSWIAIPSARIEVKDPGSVSLSFYLRIARFG
jgi:hypothetical protein